MSHIVYDFSSKTFHETVFSYYKNLSSNNEDITNLLRRITNDCTSSSEDGNTFVWNNFEGTASYTISLNNKTKSYCLNYISNSGSLSIARNETTQGTAFCLMSGYQVYADTISSTKQIEDLKVFINTKLPPSKLLMVTKLAINTLFL